MFKEHTRKLVEENISTALSILKSRTRAVYDYYSFILKQLISVSMYCGTYQIFFSLVKAVLCIILKN